ncbi:MAG: nucleotide exchange factor GrpE [Anaerolineae bacterium]|nr:MAG: protein GrpE [Chloroflexi bacterium OLB13]MBC6955211.1 nucleotide exchange factor GrpE [Chloroflexota bacterium]MBV6435109.1 Protein GrpE [Anaerolineae bacterium]MDL1914498.1 nucleotide exchange factor GrpE [Anaerolineae bacterium CFX4]OQY85927.1 MAG: nucleotide exchange factor GrpE [Anaerolineae bacterium UTCFX5]
MSQESTTPVDEAAEDSVAAAEQTPNDSQDEVGEDTASVNTVDTESKAGVSPEVAVLLAKIEEYKDGWQRERAEFTNYKRRVEREQAEVRQRGIQDTVTRLLPIIDDFERAMQHVPEELKDNSWIGGIDLLLNKFDKFLTEMNVEKIEPTGKPFDPTLHEAIGVEDTDEVESGFVSTTLQKGYISGDRVLRSALVRVAK